MHQQSAVFVVNIYWLIDWFKTFKEQSEYIKEEKNEKGHSGWKISVNKEKNYNCYKT